MTDEPLFQDADEFEKTFVGEDSVDDQPNMPPKMPSPALEHGLLIAPPLRGDQQGLESEPIDQGALGETDLTKASKLDQDESAREKARMRDATNTDAG